MEKTFQKTSAAVVVLMMVFFVFAFFRTYVGLFPSPNKDWIVHVHVITVCLWFVMLLVQPLLIYRGKREVHLALGKISYAFVPVFIAICILTIRHMQLNAKEVHVFTINIFMLVLFSVYYLLAVYYRKRNPKWHGRFMMFTIIPFIGPAATRIQFDVHLIELSVIGVLMFAEFFRGRVFKPYLIGIGCYLVLFGILLSIMIFKMDAMEELWTMLFS